MGAQEHLWYDTDADAINAAIHASGKTFEQVASALWPSMKMSSAYARLKNCLRSDKDEKLSFAEVIFICRETGRFDPIFHACDELSLHRPAIKAPADEKAELLHTIQRQQAVLIASIARLERTNTLKAVNA